MVKGKIGKKIGKNYVAVIYWLSFLKLQVYQQILIYIYIVTQSQNIR